MTRTRLGICIATIALAGVPGAAAAQGLLNQLPTGGSLGQAASGLLGGGAPALGSAPGGNIAGVLSYCLQNNALGAGNAQTANGTLGGLTGDHQVNPSSNAYQAGQQGTLQSGGTGGLSLANMPDGIKQKVCQEVLARAKSML